MPKVTDEQRRHRLARRHALAEPVADVLAAAEAMTCLHATEPASVYLAAAVRARVDRTEIDRALYDDRSVVRQLAMRRTVFAFPRTVLPAVWGSASARIARQLETRLATEVADQGIARDGARWVRRTRAAVLERLAEGPATTAELRAAVPAMEARIVLGRGKSYGGEFPIASRVLAVLAADGSVLRGRNDGGWRTSRPFWTLAAQWLGEVPAPTGEREGYAVLVGRWLHTFGPGTEADLVWWLGATKGAVRHALADLGAVEVALDDGRPAYLLPDDLDDVEPVEPWAALLPALDPTTMGWKERDFYLGEHAEKLFDRNGNGGPTAWWDGRIVGSWTQEDDGTVLVLPAERLDRPATRALADEAEWLTGWLAGDVVRSVYHSPLGRAHARR